MAEEAEVKKQSRAALLNAPLSPEKRLIRALAHLARIRDAMALQISTIVGEIDELTAEGRANVRVLLKDYGYTDAEFATYSNFTERLSAHVKDIEGEGIHFDNLRALVAIDDEARKAAIAALKKDPSMTHDDILDIARLTARGKLTQGQRVFESSEEAFQQAFLEANRLSETVFRRTATELFEMMIKHSRRSAYINRTPDRRRRLAGSPRYSAFLEKLLILRHDIRKKSGELLEQQRAIFPKSAAPMAEWARLSQISPEKAYLAQAHHSLEIMSASHFDGRIPGEQSAHFEWSAFDAIKFLSELAPDYDFGTGTGLRPSEVRKLNALDLCANAGGQALGVEAAGYYVHGLVERDADTAKTLRLNRRRWNVVEADVSAPLMDDDLKAWRGTSKRAADLDLVSGSFPIAPWTYRGNGDGELFTAAFSIIERLNPTAFFFETDVGFNAPRFSIFRQDLISRFQELGYSIKRWPLTASDFGVPQDRTRLYFVGIKNEFHSRLRAPTSRKTSATLYPALRALAFPDMSEFLSHTLKLTVSREPFDFAAAERNRNEQQVAYDKWAMWWLVKYGNRKAPDLDKHRIPAFGRSGRFWRLAGFDPQRRSLPRIGDAAFKRTDKPPLLPLSAPILQRLQGMPSDWIFEGTEESQLQQIRSIRPPRMSLAVARQIHQAITGQSVDLNDPDAWRITSGRERFIPTFVIGEASHPDPLANRARMWAMEQHERARMLADANYDDDLGDDE